VDVEWTPTFYHKGADGTMVSKKLAGKALERPQVDDLERRIAYLRARPLLLLCRTPQGVERAMTVQECCQTGSAYIRCLVPDELDVLLEQALGGERQ